MAVQYILDGYNIIKSYPGGILSRGSLEEQRERLIGLIKQRRPEGSPRNRVTIVFDGPAEIPFLDGLASRYCSGEIEIVFSEGKTADETIEETVHRSRNPVELVVVTDDRGIRRLLGGSGVKFMTVVQFGDRLFAPSAPRVSPDEKEGGQGWCDLEEELKKRWLR